MKSIFTRLIATVLSLSLATLQIAHAQGIDPAARGLAVQAKANASAVSIAASKVGTVGVRYFGGRVYRTFSIPANSSGTTFEVMMTTATDFDAVRIIYAMGNLDPSGGAITPTVIGRVAVVGDPSDATISALPTSSWITQTWGGTAANNYMGGSSPGTLPPAATSARRGFTISDLIPISSVPRTDGGKYPLLLVRADLYTPDSSGGQIVISGTATSTVANWATHPSGRIWRQMWRNGAWVNTGLMTNVDGGSPIAGVIYYARGKIVNVAGFGDSITESVGGTYRGEGFGFPATQALTAAGGPAYEWSNFGWESQNTTAILQNLNDAVALGLPFNVGVIPNGSPNDVANGSGSVGSISGTTLTVTTANSGFAVGQYIYLPGITPGTYITALGTGTGSTGTYTVNISQTVASGALSNTNPITSTIINATRWKAQMMYNKLAGAGISPVIWTWLPTNDAQKTYGPSDSLRVAYNSDLRARAASGMVVADFDTALSGVTNSAGQVQYLAGATTDNIHPNDTGNAILAPMLQKAISKAFYVGPGSVVGR